MLLNYKHSDLVKKIDKHFSVWLASFGLPFVLPTYASVDCRIFPFYPHLSCLCHFVSHLDQCSYRVGQHHIVDCDYNLWSCVCGVLLFFFKHDLLWMLFLTFECKAFKAQSFPFMLCVSRFVSLEWWICRVIGKRIWKEVQKCGGGCYIQQPGCKCSCRTPLRIRTGLDCQSDSLPGLFIL